MAKVTQENLLNSLKYDSHHNVSWGIEFTGCVNSYNRLLKFIYHSSICLDEDNVNDVLKYVNGTTDDTLWFKPLLYSQRIITDDTNISDTLTVVYLDDALIPESMVIKKERPIFMWVVNCSTK